ncbi:cation diffusion facilitator family transporter [Deltaproteobacteria bacterium]|nr:cation diffusion facilitator family transporter [Deltaproteobacteria bacterium]
MPKHREHEHHHDHDRDHDHNHDLRAMSYKRLWWALIINLIFLVVEVIGGILTNSLALLADAGHMLTDVGALALALFVAHIAGRPATPDRTFGLLRAEVLGAFVNGATLVLIVGLILWEAWKRLGHVNEIDGPVMLLVAVLGLIANIISAMILAKGRKENVNVRGAFLHMVADALGSVGAIVAGVVIWTTAWYPVDSIASIVIGLLILWSSWGFLKQTMNILLEATPENIDFIEVKTALEAMEHIDEVHDLHIWTITSGMPILSGHITLSSCCSETKHWQECLAEAQKILKERFGIEHTTLQVEACGSSCGTECLLKEDS